MGDKKVTDISEAPARILNAIRRGPYLNMPHQIPIESYQTLQTADPAPRNTNRQRQTIKRQISSNQASPNNIRTVSKKVLKQV